VVRFYNKSGTAEQWIKEGKQAVAMTRLSRHRFRANEVRLCRTIQTRCIFGRGVPTRCENRHRWLTPWTKIG
jgi:hypothetical protein